MKKLKTILPIMAMIISMCFVVVACGGKKIESIVLKEGSIATGYTQNEEVDLSGLIIIVKYNDGTTEEITKDKLEVGTIDTSVVGEQKLTIKYEGKTLDVNILVSNNLDEVYDIFGVDLPTYLTVDKSNFYEQDHDYVVGDDNPFKFLPNITVLDNDDNLVTINRYKSISTIYKYNEASQIYEELTGANLTSTVTVDEENSTYDFSDVSIGNKYKLMVRPYYLTAEQAEDDDFTVSFEFKVVDGWNAYTVADLSRIDNSQDEWNEYKTNHGIGNEKINGLVLHGNMTITMNDIASGFIYNSQETRETEYTEQNYTNTAVQNTLKDGTLIYERTIGGDYGVFTLYGNYFTIDASQIAPASDLGADFSNTALIAYTSAYNRDSNNNKIALENTVNTNGLIKNINFIGNAKRQEEEAYKGFGGLILFKSFRSLTTTVENCTVNAFFIGIFPEFYESKIVVNKVKVIDSFQSGIYASQGITLEINDSLISKSGGPAIIVQHQENDVRSPIVNVSNTLIDCPVAGQEAWFNSIEGLSAMVTQIKALDQIFRLQFDKTFLKGNTSSEQELAKATMNIIAVLKDADAASPVEATGVQGKITIDGYLAIDKDPIPADATLNVHQKVQQLQSENPVYASAPILVNKTGVIIIYTGDQSNPVVLPQVMEGEMTQEEAYNKISSSDNDSLTLYIGGLAAVLNRYDLETE